jgi:hypothetical protein
MTMDQGRQFIGIRGGIGWTRCRGETGRLVTAMSRPGRNRRIAPGQVSAVRRERCERFGCCPGRRSTRVKLRHTAPAAMATNTMIGGQALVRPMVTTWEDVAQERESVTGALRNSGLGVQPAGEGRSVMVWLQGQERVSLFSRGSQR